VGSNELVYDILSRAQLVRAYLHEVLPNEGAEDHTKTAVARDQRASGSHRAGPEPEPVHASCAQPGRALRSRRRGRALARSVYRVAQVS
jgi:hypothetical protein